MQLVGRINRSHTGKKKKEIMINWDVLKLDELRRTKNDKTLKLLEFCKLKKKENHFNLKNNKVKVGEFLNIKLYDTYILYINYVNLRFN